MKEQGKLTQGQCDQCQLYVFARSTLQRPNLFLHARWRVHLPCCLPQKASSPHQLSHPSSSKVVQHLKARAWVCEASHSGKREALFG